MILSQLFPFPKKSFVTIQGGFSLIEMAIVLVILGFLLGGVMIPLTTQREESQRQATERQLQEIRNALIGFAQTNRRLPCPVSAANQGIEQPIPAAGCVVSATNYFVPYVTLGLQGTIIGTPGVSGQLADAWSQPIIYRLSAVNLSEYARTILVTSTAPDLQVCSTSVGATATDCAAGATVAGNTTPATPTTGTIVAVILSTGPNGANAPASADETENRDVDPIFVTDTLRANFDDILVWISRPTLVYELSRANQL
jgi:prepilin-type N-terminal cleavage/methylation domain-containing protein